MICVSGGDDGPQDISVIQIYELITELSQLQGKKTAIFSSMLGIFVLVEKPILHYSTYY